MNYRGLVKRLDLPAGWLPPAELEYDDIRARAISHADNDDDVQGINASIELIRRTRGGSWPTEPVSVDFNYVDEVWHECEFREGDSFTYAVYDSRGQYLGCCYLYPMGRRTPLTEDLLTCDVDVSWWVTPDAYEHGYYTKLYAALRHWIETAFPFTNAYYSNTEIPGLGFPSYRGHIALKEEGRWERHAGSSTPISGRARSGWSGRPVSRSRRWPGIWGSTKARWATGST